jgi:hypothetical protein
MTVEDCGGSVEDLDVYPPLCKLLKVLSNSALVEDMEDIFSFFKRKRKYIRN